MAVSRVLAGSTLVLEKSLQVKRLPFIALHTLCSLTIDIIIDSNINIDIDADYLNQHSGTASIIIAHHPPPTKCGRV